MRTGTPPIRVAHVLTSLEIGGAEMVVVRLIGALDQARHESRVICLRRLGPLAAVLRARGIEVECLHVGSGRGVIHLARALRAAIRRQPTDVVHTHNVSPLIAAGLALVGIDTVRLVHTKHGRATAASAAGRLALRHAARRAAAVAAVSADAAAMATGEEGFPEDRVSVVLNGIDAGPVPVEREVRWRAITVARLEAVKDQATMLRAAQRLVARDSRFHLDIVGDGNERAPLEQLARELGIESSVTFHGFRDDVRTMLDRANVFLLSSVSEGISLTLLEAMAAGLPIVATSVGGNPEVVEDGTSGILVPPRDPDALAEAASELLAHPDRARAMGLAARARVERVFGISAMAGWYTAAYSGDG